MKVYICYDYVHSALLYDTTETIENYGEDYLDEYGTDIPDELAERYLKNDKERREIMSELKKYKSE